MALASWYVTIAMSDNEPLIRQLCQPEQHPSWTGCKATQNRVWLCLCHEGSHQVSPIDHQHFISTCGAASVPHVSGHTIILLSVLLQPGARVYQLLIFFCSMSGF